jgi:hypothetical protein
MATESFLVTTLPRTADPARSVHLSLFVTHRLTPDGAQGVVGDFAVVSDWTTAVAGAEFELRARAGGTAFTIPITADLDRLDPSLWPRVFPADLAVRPWQTPDLAATEWRTFPAHRMQDHALLAHAASVFSSPVGSPGVQGNVLTGFVMDALGLGQFERRLPLDVLLGDEVDIDQWATDYLDDLTDGGMSSEVGSTQQPLLGLTTDVHRARRYYQRPEEQRDYRDEPDPNATAVPVAKPDPDFHERAGLLGDLSPLLRQLGLVIDIHIDDLSALAGVTEISASITVPGLDNPILTQPRTACEVQGHGFWATSTSGDHHRGLLRLGDEDRFRVLDLDPDASALKLEQYVRNVPRMLATEQNGDQVTSAPPSLRATGLAIARVDRSDQLRSQLTGAPAHDAALTSGTAAPLTIDDLAVGIRLEVWDDVTGEWHSLHRRRLDVEIEGAGLVIEDVPDTGFLQGAALTQAEDPEGATVDAPYHAHEVLAGWDGWSLSVPRPGKVVVHGDDGEELLVDAPDPDPDPVNPVASTTRIEPLTLPWLRYGRSYSFRAWTVDLAGNSAPHTVAGPQGADLDGASASGAGRSRGRPRAGTSRAVETAKRAAEGHVASRSRDAMRAVEVTTTVRDAVRALHPVSQPGPRPGAGAPGLDLAGVAPTGVSEVDALVRDRAARHVESAARIGPTRRERVETTFHAAAADVPHLMERTDAGLTADVLGNAVASVAMGHLDLPSLDVSVIQELLHLVTVPRPFLRWDPVVEPVVVPRHPYTEAESLLTVVIRSGVEATGGDDPYEVTITDPGTYSTQVLAAHPDLDLLWRADSQRHLAPPKSSQFEAELHGRFDPAFGDASPAAVRAALGIALKEAGTFLDATIADVDNPGARITQPGIAFHSGPTAEIPDVTDPADLERGTPLTPGQYVIHDTDELVLPYLPDPLASKLSMTFPDAGQGHHLLGLWAIEGVTLPYAGTWPELRPYRLVLETGDVLSADTTTDVVRFQVPPGEQLRMNLSSAMARADLDLLGLWRSLPEILRQIDVVADAAADGWFWWLTPPTQMRLVHAVPRPVEVPRTTVLVPARVDDGTDVRLFGGVDVHGPSTERLDIEAEWGEWVDDITKPGPEQITVKAAAASTTVRYDEDLVVLGGEEDSTIPLPDGTALEVHAAVHQLGDTKHRDIDYRMRASTRYREYFDPRVVPTIDDVSLVGPATRLDVASTARPNKPVVADVLPLFRWFEETEPEQPFGLRRTRRSGLRIYLDRPWYSSGDGELLGLVLAMGSDAAVEDHVSLWGGDPAYLQEGPAHRSILPLTDLTHLVGLDDRREGGRPVGPPTPRTLIDVPGNPAVWILGYEPEYSTERRLWFADIAMDPGTAIWPFVRLALTRFQPSSRPGKHLSPVVLCDFLPLPPERMATLTRPDRRRARVVVTGPIGVPNMGSGGLNRNFLQALLESRTMRARLEHKVPGVPSDLGWETVATLDLPILGVNGTVVSWSGELDLPRAMPPRRPGSSQAWRVVVEEWEHLPSDPTPGTRGPARQSRVVYADHLPL